jgi:peroxiredoxin
MKYIPYGVAAVLAALLGGLFFAALPDATARAREGHRRAAESACDSLKPSPSPILGSFPVAAPDFTLKDFQGRNVSLSQFRGHVVLVNFWATWCSTCVVEMPSMEQLVRRMQGKPFRLLAVSVDDDWQAVRKFFAKGTTLDVLLDTARDVPKKYGTEKFPETFLVDRDGNIRYYVVSDRDWNQPAVTACIDALINS